MKYRTYCRLPVVMNVVAIASVCSALCSVVCASDIHGQTLFAQSDTTPNYATAYQHIEECWSAVIRISQADAYHRDSIWQDTIEAYAWREQNKGKVQEDWWAKRRPEPAIHAIQVCLNKFNPDTATFLSQYSALRIVKILLIAHRDEDARRFAERALDSLRQKSVTEYKLMLYQLMREYGLAQPIRYDAVKQYYTRFLAARENGDLLYYTIDAALEFGGFADRVKDTTARARANQLALQLNDSTPEGERRKYPGAGRRQSALAGIVARNTGNEALDSLTISNLAYELWWVNTVKRRVYGGDLVTRAEMAEALEKRKMIEIHGEHYYIASTATSSGVSTHGLVTYTSEGALPKGALPVKNTINFIVGMPALCHTETQRRARIDKSSNVGCLDVAANIRSLKHEFPDIEIIGLSNTYGTVGQLGPLTPAEEADTLAKLFLEFHRLPARLVVENTEFYNLPEPDGRRIDIVTPNTEACTERGGCGKFVDKDGNLIDAYITSNDEWLKRFYEILKNRPSK